MGWLAQADRHLGQTMYFLPGIQDSDKNQGPLQEHEHSMSAICMTTTMWTYYRTTATFRLAYPPSDCGRSFFPLAMQKFFFSVTQHPLPVLKPWSHTGSLILGPHYTYLLMEDHSSPLNFGRLFPAFWAPSSSSPPSTSPSQSDWLSVSTAT